MDLIKIKKGCKSTLGHILYSNNDQIIDFKRTNEKFEYQLTLYKEFTNQYEI